MAKRVVIMDEADFRSIRTLCHDTKIIVEQNFQPSYFTNEVLRKLREIEIFLKEDGV